MAAEPLHNRTAIKLGQGAGEGDALMQLHWGGVVRVQMCKEHRSSWPGCCTACGSNQQAASIWLGQIAAALRRSSCTCTHNLCPCDVDESAAWQCQHAV
jgi:hypothetical protein